VNFKFCKISIIVALLRKFSTQFGMDITSMMNRFTAEPRFRREQSVLAMQVDFIDQKRKSWCQGMTQGYDVLRVLLFVLLSFWYACCGSFYVLVFKKTVNNNNG